MKVLTIIKEEVINYFEGVGDKYAEKAFGISDKARNYLKQTEPAVNIDMGEFVGYIFDKYNNEKLSAIYKNPRSLKGFEEDVRAVSDKNGNLYIAQTDGNFVHREFEDIMNTDIYDIEKNIGWMRIADTNNFGYSDSSDHKTEYAGDTLKLSVEIRIKKLREKSPQYGFHSEYWENVEFNDMIEGIGDKYAKKAFNIPDTGQEFQDKWKKRVQTDTINKENGKLVGEIRTDDESLSNIYMNPRTLKNFDPDVKAITDKDGNLYIAQLDSGFFHSSISNEIEKHGYRIGNAYDTDNNCTWHRLGKSNQFGMSISHVQNFFIMNKNGLYDKILPEYQDKIEQDVRIAQQKNPQFKFIGKYWRI